jgi:hypothetical protein
MERHAAGYRKIALVIDPAVEARAWKFERLISVAATLVDYFCAKGWSLSLYGTFAPEGVDGARESLLGALALAERQRGEILTLIPERQASIVLCVEPVVDAPPHALALTLADCEDLVELSPRIQ